MTSAVGTTVFRSISAKLSRFLLATEVGLPTEDVPGMCVFAAWMSESTLFAG